MGHFVKNSPWTRFAFPPSEQPDAGPGLLSDDVQYTHDYYGGGYSFKDTNEWFSSIDLTKTADNTFQSITQMPKDQLTMLLGMSVANITANQVVSLAGGLLVSSVQLGVGKLVGLQFTSPIINAGTPAQAVWPMFPFGQRIILPPEPCELRFYFFAGDNVTYRFSFMSVSIPRGAAFQGP